MNDHKDLIARCIWHGVEMQERIGPVDNIPYWECPECIKQYTDYLQTKGKRKIVRLKSWGRHHAGGHRNLYDDWRLRWWYHARTLDNHYKAIGLTIHDCKVPIKAGQAFLPLMINRRWSVKVPQS